MRWAPPIPFTLLFLTGCASMGAMQTADTLGPGKLQVGLEVSQQAQVSRDTLTSYPMAGLSVRIGVLDWLDVGGRLGPSGGELQPKVRLTPKRLPFIVSAAPSFGLSLLDTNGIVLRFYNLALPLILGIPLEGGHQWVFTARFNDTIAYESAGSAKGLIHLTFGSVSAGFAARVWRFLVLPELAVAAPLWTHSERTDLDTAGLAFGQGRLQVQLNLTILYGGVKE